MTSWDLQLVITACTFVFLVVDVIFVTLMFRIFRATCDEQCQRIVKNCDEAIARLDASDEKFFSRRR